MCRYTVDEVHRKSVSKSRWLLTVVSLTICNVTFSQDLFESNVSTTRSYNYLELQYLFNVDASPPLMATLLLGVSRNWSLKAEYSTRDETELLPTLQGDADSVRIDVESQSGSIGALFHTAVPAIDHTDFIVGLMFGRTEIKGEVLSDFLNFTVDDSRAFQEAHVGFRRSFLPTLEGEIAVNYRRESDDSETTADITLVFRALEFFDVAFAGNQLGGEQTLGIGLRYTW